MDLDKEKIIKFQDDLEHKVLKHKNKIIEYYKAIKDEEKCLHDTIKQYYLDAGCPEDIINKALTKQKKNAKNADYLDKLIGLFNIDEKNKKK